MGTDYSHFTYIYILWVFSCCLYVICFSSALLPCFLSFLLPSCRQFFIFKIWINWLSKHADGAPSEQAQSRPAPLAVTDPCPSSVLIPSTSSSLSSIPSTLLPLSAPAPVPNVNAIAGVGVGEPNPMNRAGIAALARRVSCQLRRGQLTPETRARNGKCVANRQRLRRLQFQSRRNRLRVDP